jgi:hypothetical protein
VGDVAVCGRSTFDVGHGGPTLLCTAQQRDEWIDVAKRRLAVGTVAIDVAVPRIAARVAGGLPVVEDRAYSALTTRNPRRSASTRRFATCGWAIGTGPTGVSNSTASGWADGSQAA